MLKYNAIYCKHCKMIIASRETHQFVQCSCGRIAVDGGLEYSRLIGNLDDMIILTVYGTKFAEQGAKVYIRSGWFGLCVWLRYFTVRQMKDSFRYAISNDELMALLETAQGIADGVEQAKIRLEIDNRG